MTPSHQSRNNAHYELFKDLYLQHVNYTKRESMNKMNEELRNVRANKHREYIQYMEHDNGNQMRSIDYNHEEKVEVTVVKEIEIKSNIMKPQSKSIIILSDSMLSQIDKARLSKNYNVQVLIHAGCTVKCIYSNLSPLFRSNPVYVLLHKSTNDCTSKSSEEIFLELIQIKLYIENKLPTCTVVILQPTCTVVMSLPTCTVVI